MLIMDKEIEKVLLIESTPSYYLIRKTLVLNTGSDPPPFGSLLLNTSLRISSKKFYRMVSYSSFYTHSSSTRLSVSSRRRKKKERLPSRLSPFAKQHYEVLLKEMPPPFSGSSLSHAFLPTTTPHLFIQWKELSNKKAKKEKRGRTER